MKKKRMKPIAFMGRMPKSTNSQIKLVPVKFIPEEIRRTALSNLIDQAKKSKSRYLRVDGIKQYTAYSLKNKLKREKIKMDVLSVNKKVYIVKTM